MEKPFLFGGEDVVRVSWTSRRHSGASLSCTSFIKLARYRALGAGFGL